MNESELPEDRVLSVRHLCVQFTTYEGVARAVDTVTCDVRHGETLGLVGESGCGKSVTALSIVRLVPTPPGRITSGNIWFRPIPRAGEPPNRAPVDLLTLRKSDMCRVRGDQISMIFQEPMTSLNPVFCVGEQVAEVFRTHRGLSRRDARLAAVQMLAKVQIPTPAERYKDYPHQLSGGMRQRVMIAIALACDPSLLLADEPTTALDVTVQAQILELMEQLKTSRQGAVVLITHDLGVIAEVADRVAVMYAGEIVEQQTVQGLFEDPLHPYTQGLLRSIPARQVRQQQLYVIPGSVPNATRYPTGCRFAGRCAVKHALCDQYHPPAATRPNGALVRCFLYDECVAALRVPGADAGQAA